VYRSHAEVGYYVLGYKVAQVLQIALAAFMMGWAPLRFKIYERHDAQAVYRRLTSAYAVGATTLTVALALLAREVVALISPASYSPAAGIVPYIVFGYLLNGLYILMVTGMGVAKRTVPMALVVTFAALVNIGANVVLIPVWGMKAAAVTTVLANIVMVVGCWYFSQRAYPIPYDWPRILRTGILGAAVVAIAVSVAPGRGVAGLAAAGLAWLVFIALLVGTRTVRTQEIAQLLARMRQLFRRITPPRDRELVS
jgi:O-antigen/teichoic acid export membrane protein